MDLEELRTLWAERDRRYREGVKRRELEPREADAVRAYRVGECNLVPDGVARTACRTAAWRWTAPGRFA